jgi:hypothetical protein
MEIIYENMQFIILITSCIKYELFESTQNLETNAFCLIINDRIIIIKLLAGKFFPPSIYLLLQYRYIYI